MALATDFEKEKFCCGNVEKVVSSHDHLCKASGFTPWGRAKKRFWKKKSTKHLSINLSIRMQTRAVQSKSIKKVQKSEKVGGSDLVLRKDFWYFFLQIRGGTKLFY